MGGRLFAPVFLGGAVIGGWRLFLVQAGVFFLLGCILPVFFVRDGTHPETACAAAVRAVVALRRWKQYRFQVFEEIFHADSIAGAGNKGHGYHR